MPLEQQFAYCVDKFIEHFLEYHTSSYDTTGVEQIIPFIPFTKLIRYFWDFWNQYVKLKYPENGVIMFRNYLSSHKTYRFEAGNLYNYIPK